MYSSSTHLPLEAESGRSLFGEGVVQELMLELLLDDGDKECLNEAGSRQLLLTNPCATGKNKTKNMKV